MAFYDNSDDQEQVLDPNAPPAQPGQQGGSVISGQGASGSSGATPAAAAAPTPASGEVGGTSSGGSPFVGIKQYLDANKSQSGKLANDTAGVVNAASQQARDTIPQQTDLYNKAVDQATVRLDQPVFDEARDRAEKVAADAAKKASFVRMRDAQYTGPQSLETSDFYQPIEESFKKATTAGENTKTEQGQGQLLSDLQQQTRGKVNQSAINLDRLLLKDDNARGILQKSVTDQEDLPGLLQEANAKSEAAALTGRNITDATRNSVQSVFGGTSNVQTQLQQAIQARVAPLVDKGKKEADTLKKLLSGNKEPTAEQYKQLGITSGQFRELRSMMNEYDLLNSANNVGQNRLSLSNYLTNTNSGITAQQVANPEEYARYAALNSLMNTNNSFLTDPSKANSYSTDPIDLNYNKAKESISQSLKALKEKIQKTADDAKRRAEERKQETDDKLADDVAAGVGTVFGPTTGSTAGAAVNYGKKKNYW